MAIIYLDDVHTAGGDATGSAQRAPLAKIVWYYHTHLAIIPNVVFISISLIQLRFFEVAFSIQEACSPPNLSILPSSVI